MIPILMLLFTMTIVAILGGFRVVFKDTIATITYLTILYVIFLLYFVNAFHVWEAYEIKPLFKAIYPESASSSAKPLQQIESKLETI